MNKILLLSFLILASLCNEFNFDECSCDIYDEYYAIACPVVGLPSGSQWTYTDLPKDWNYTGEVIFAPRKKIIDNDIYGLKLQIINSVGNIILLKKALLFTFLHGEIRHFADLDYDFTDKTIYDDVIFNSHVITYPTNVTPRKSLLGGILGAVIGSVGAIINGVLFSVAQILNAIGDKIEYYFPYGPKKTIVFRGKKGSI